RGWLWGNRGTTLTNRRVDKPLSIMEARILRINLDELEAQALMAVSPAMALDKIAAIYPDGIREMAAAE
ncbi:hypothetical protein, partial [Pseudomonas syringae group genomosp. 7]|uniref:hypothetical protein n=1 Tax=Pseudomonas syringae group genomosp. 7 TaxID=251699 RepID=UPI00376F901C